MLIEKNNFITNEDCDEIIKIGEISFTEATTLGENNGYRVALFTWISNDEPISRKIKWMTSIETGLPVENMELLHVVKYEVGGEYKNHHDILHPGESYYENEMKRGGQRVKSVIFYLNDDFEGGQTEFPEMNIKVEPVKSKVIIWDNINEDGTLDYSTIHAGLPVTKGVKYIATIWIREEIFI